MAHSGSRARCRADTWTEKGVRTLDSAAAVLCVVLLTASCASDGPRSSTVDSSASPSTSPRDGDGQGMDGMDMGVKAGGGPTDTAAMVCGDEIREAVQRTFVLSRAPRPTSHWTRSTRLFVCDYTLSGQRFEVSVQDATDERAGRVFFQRLRSDLPGATRIRGLENFGFPAFSTEAGDVAFLKDGKTLHVDATRLTGRALPPAYSREDAAYSIASAVIGCWTE